MERAEPLAIDMNGTTRMNMMRDGMTTCRKRKKFHERRKWKVNNRKKRAKVYKGQTFLEADDSEKSSIQEEGDLVVVGQT